MQQRLSPSLKMKDIEWIFFDIGSTLVDETKAYEHRIRDTISNADITYKRFYDKMIYFASQGKNGYIEAAKYYGLSRTPWHSEDEILYPASETCLKQLYGKYKLGIIANQLPGMQERLCKMGIEKYMSLLISSADEGVSKPDLEIFHIALERANCAAQNAIMIGDRLDNDIAPANNVGMYTIWVKQGLGGLSSPKCKSEIADYTVYSISEIWGLFAE